MASAYIRNHCYNNNTRKNPNVKPNLNKMHIFGTIYFCYVQNKMKLDPRCEKGIFVGYDTQSPAYLIYFLETMVIKRVRCVKFIDSYDNGSLSKADNNTEYPESLITHDVEPKDNLNTKGEGQISHYPIRQRKRPNFFVENFEFGGVDCCCTLCMILANYSESVNSPDSNKQILAMRGEFDSLVENNTFDWQKTLKNRNIISGFFTIKSKSDGSHEYKAHFVAKGSYSKYMVRIIEKLRPQQQIQLP